MPFAHGQALYQAAPEPKQFLELQGGHNNGFIYMREEWVSALGDFMRRNLVILRNAQLGPSKRVACCLINWSE